MVSIKLDLDGCGAEDLGQCCNAESEENTAFFFYFKEYFNVFLTQSLTFKVEV